METYEELQRLSAQRKKKRRTIVIISVLGFFMLVGIMRSISEETGDKPKVDQANTQNEDKSTMAFIISQEFVKLSLVSPSTADFPAMDYQHKKYKDQVYEISSYVDSQNKLGATLRTNWTVTLQYIGGNEASRASWKLLNIKTL